MSHDQNVNILCNGNFLSAQQGYTVYHRQNKYIIESTVPQTEFQISVQRFHHALAHVSFIINHYYNY